jgi:hypothetical protein
VGYTGLSTVQLNDLIATLPTGLTSKILRVYGATGAGGSLNSPPSGWTINNTS